MSVLTAIAVSLGLTLLLVAAVAFVSARVRLVRQLAFPLYVGALAAGLKVFGLGQPAGRLDSALSWLLAFLVCVLALKILGLYVFNVHLPSRRDVRLPPLLPKVAMGSVYLVSALILLRVIFPELPLAPLLTTSAVTSLVLGLALQPILGNFFAGVVISLEHPFRINDWVKTGDTVGQVMKISWRTTHVRTRDNDTVVIPNAKIAEQEILNYFSPHPLHLERIYIGVHYRTPPYRVKQALLDVADRVDGVLKKPTPTVFVHDFADSAVTYEFRVWVEDIANIPRINSHLRSEIWEEFKRRDITIPYPIRTLEIDPLARTLEIARPKRLEESDVPVRPTASLFVYQGPDRGRSCELDGDSVTVGRSSGSTLTLREPLASKEHIRIDWRDGRHVVADLASQNGTLINGEPLLEERPLRHLDHLTVGDTVIIFECEGGHA